MLPVVPMLTLNNGPQRQTNKKTPPFVRFEKVKSQAPVSVSCQIFTNVLSFREFFANW